MKGLCLHPNAIYIYIAILKDTGCKIYNSLVNTNKRNLQAIRTEAIQASELFLCNRMAIEQDELLQMFKSLLDSHTLANFVKAGEDLCTQLLHLFDNNHLTCACCRVAIGEKAFSN